MKTGIVAASMIALVTTFVAFSAVQAQEPTSTTGSSYSLEDVMQSRQEAGQNRQESLAQRQAEHEEQMEARKDAVCEQLQARINNRLNRYEANKDKYHNRYRGIHTKVTDLADKLEDQGCEVTQIRTDLTTFEALLEDFADSFRIFVEHMKTARTHACGESDTEFRSDAGTAREYLLAMRQKAQTLHQFIKGSLKTHVHETAQACRAQVDQNQE